MIFPQTLDFSLNFIVTAAEMEFKAHLFLPLPRKNSAVQPDLEESPQRSAECSAELPVKSDMLLNAAATL